MTSNAVTSSSPSSITRKKKWPSVYSNEQQKADHRREQAAERQRRKRERDRLGITVRQQQEMMAMAAAAMSSLTSTTNVDDQSETQHHDAESQPREQQPGPLILSTRPSSSATSAVPQQQSSTPSASFMSTQAQADMSPEEAARRDRVRASARERQRKHRAMVKMRKMENVNAGGNAYPPPGMVLPPPPQEHMSNLMQVFHQQQQQFPPIPPPGPEPFPPQQPQVRGGQTFATTLLLSFSCAPLLKQHLLRTLNMTDEELASLEPVIADAWEQWDAQRRMYQELGQHQQPPADTASAPRFRVVPQSSENNVRTAEAAGASTLDPSLATNSEEAPADAPPP